MPAGEVSTAPIEVTANGVIVIDAMDDYAKIARIFKTVMNSRNVAEFGVGINPKAKLIGNNVKFSLAGRW